MAESQNGDIRLSLQLGMDTSEVKQKAKALSEELRKTLNAGKGSDNPQMQRLQQQMQKASFTAADLQKELHELESTKVPTAQYTELQNQISAARKKLGELAAEEERWQKATAGRGTGRMVAASELQKIEEEAKKVEASLNKLKAAEREMQKSGKAFQPTDQDKLGQTLQKLLLANMKSAELLNRYQQLAEKINTTQKPKADVSKQPTMWNASPEDSQYQKIIGHTGELSKQFSGLRSAARVFSATAKGAFTVVKSGIVGAIKAIKTFRSAIFGIARVVRSLNNVFKTLRNKVKEAFNGANSSIKGSLKQLIRYGLGIRGLFALFRKLRGYATDAFKGIAQQSASFNRTMSNITNTFTQFKNSIGTMLQPLISAIEPVLVRIMELFINAANAVGSFFATLTGQKYIYKAIKPTTSYADSVEETGKAAKKAAKQLAEYDKLMVIQTQDAEDAASANGGGSMFTEELVDPSSSISQFAQQLRDAWEREDFAAIGEIIGEKINELVSKIDEAIKWDNIGPKITEWVNKFGTAFNSLIDTVDWPLIGQTIGDGLNTIIYSVDTFLDAFNLDELGTKFSEVFNSLNDTVDWDALGTTVAKGLNEMSNAINNFVDNTNWKSFGSNLASALNSMVDEVDGTALGKRLSAKLKVLFETANGFVHEFHWEDAGAKLSDVFEGWFENIDFTTLGDTLATGLNGIADTINKFADDTDWPALGRKIAGGISKFVNTIDGTAIGDALSTPFDTATRTINSMLQKFEENGTWSTAGKKIGQTINGWFSGIPWKTVGQNITLGVDGVVDAISALFDETNWKDIGADLSEILNGIINIDWKDVGKTIGDGATDLIDGITSLLENTNWEQLGKDVIDLIMGVDWPKLFKSAANGISAIIVAAMDIVIGLVEEFDFIDFVDTVISSILAFALNVDWGKFTTELAQFAGTFLRKLFALPDNIGAYITQTFAELIVKVTTWFNNKKSEWDEAGLSIWEGIFQGIWNGVKNIATWFKEKLLDPFIEGFKNAFGIHSPSTVMAEMGGYLIDGLKQGLGNIWEAVKGKFTELLGKIKDWFVEKKQDLIAAWDAFKSGIGDITATLKAKIDKTFEDAKAAWDNLKEKAKEVWANFKAKIDKTFEDATAIWDGLKEKAKEVWANFKGSVDKTFTDAKASWDNLKEKGKELLASVKGSIEKTFTDAKASWDGLKEKGKDLLANVKGSVEKAFTDAKSTWDELKDKTTKTLTSAFKSAGEKTLDTVQSAWAGIKEGTKNLVTSFAQTGYKSMKNVKSVWAGITAGTKNLIANISAKWQTTKETIKGWWTVVLDWFNGGNGSGSKVKQNRTFNIGSHNTTTSKTVSSWWSSIKSWWGSKTLGVEGKLKITAAEMGKGVVVRGNAVVDLNSGGGGGHYTREATGAIISNPTKVIVGEAGPEAIIPLKNHTEWLDIVSKYVVQHMNLGKIEIPHLAKGQVIPPNRQFIAMLGDQRHGTNVETPLKTIEEALENVINRMNKSSNSAPIILQLDGRQIAQVVWNESDKRYKQTGKSFAY